MSAQEASIERRIRLCYANIPAAERKLADLLLDFPGDVAAYAATELADLAGVSKAAATRLFQRLGFKNYEEARRLARNTQNWGAPLYLQSSDRTGSTFDADRQTYIDDEMSAIDQTLSSLEEGEITDIVSALSHAVNIWMVGYRYNQVIAAYAQWQFLQFRKNVHLLPGPGQTMGEFTSGFGKEDVIVVAGFRRRTPELKKLMKTVTDTGARILYITDRTAKETPSYATWTLRCTTSGQYMFDSYSPAMSVIRFLSIKTFNSMGKQARNHLETIERHHAALAELA
jgi:DNA-binding MurR/RpiR family transcriptional regulator